MEIEIISKLNDSLDELEVSVSRAKKALTTKQPIPLDVMKRISSYEDIIGKQRVLSQRLLGFIAQGEWDEVTRHVKLINGLSAMIHEDATALLKNLALEFSFEEAESSFLV